MKSGYPTNILSFKGYILEAEINSTKGRIACYIKNGISYVRRHDLEGTDSRMLILDIKGKIDTRIINLYRCFSPADGSSPLLTS